MYTNKNCPVCGGYVVLLPNGSEICEKCHYLLHGYIKEMAKKKKITGNPFYPGTAVGKAIGSDESQTLTITNCEKFKVQLREVDIEFELEPDKLENIDTLIINGYKYVKER